MDHEICTIAAVINGTSLIRIMEVPLIAVAMVHTQGFDLCAFVQIEGFLQNFAYSKKK